MSGPCLSPARRDYGFTVPGNPNDRLVLPGAEALPEINAESLLQALGLEGRGCCLPGAWCRMHSEALPEINAMSLTQALGLEGGEGIHPPLASSPPILSPPIPPSAPYPFIPHLPPGDWQQQGELTPVVTAVQGAAAGKGGQQQAAAAAEQLSLLLSRLSALAGEPDCGSDAGSSSYAGTATMRRLRCALLSLKLNDGYSQQQSKGGSSEGGLFAGLFPQAWSKSGDSYCWVNADVWITAVCVVHM